MNVLARLLHTACAAVLSAIAVLILTGTPAAAHVLLAKAQPNGDGTTTLTFSFDHGCADAPTTELTVSLPPGVSATTTTQPTAWTSTLTTGSGRAQPEPGLGGGEHGPGHTVSWTGPGITPGVNAEFSVVTRITATVGQSIRFPTVQRCDNGASYEWTDPQPGDEHPAPMLIATAAILAPTPPQTPLRSTTASRGDGATLPQILTAIAAFVLTAATLALWLTRRAPHRR